MGGLPPRQLLPKVPAAEPFPTYLFFLLYILSIHFVPSFRLMSSGSVCNALQSSFPLSLRLLRVVALFLDTESTRAEAICLVCRNSRVELADIIISQQKSKSEDIKQGSAP